MKTLASYLGLAALAHAAPPPAFFKALHQVETGGRAGLLDALEGLADRSVAPRDLPPLRFPRLRHALHSLRKLRGRLVDGGAPEG